MRPSERIDIHPTDHQASQLSTRDFDVICIGSGWAGRTLAARIVAAGYTAVVVEKELVGGDCPFWACVPSKVLLCSGDALDGANGVGGARENVSSDHVNAGGTLQRRDLFVAGWDDSKALVPLVESTGVYIARGAGRLVGERQVSVQSSKGDQVRLTARLAVALCTGSEHRMPDIPGLSEIDAWSPRDATSSSSVPKSLIIIGAGAVGCELATAYNQLGSRVSLISRSAEILPNLDPEPGRIVREALEKHGVTIYFSNEVIKTQRQSDGTALATLSGGQRLTASEILVAAGRKATIEDLGLESLAVPVKNGFVAVDASFRTLDSHSSWLYAVGDVNGKAMFTHSAKYQAVIASNAIIAQAKAAATGLPTCAREDVTPQVIFTSPNVASVGLTHKSAVARGISVRRILAPAGFAGPGYWIQRDANLTEESWMQWLVDHEDRLVGATLVGNDVSELLHASTMAIAGNMTLSQIAHAVPSFPTVSFSYYNLMDAAGI